MQLWIWLTAVATLASAHGLSDHLPRPPLHRRGSSRAPAPPPSHHRSPPPPPPVHKSPPPPPPAHKAPAPVPVTSKPAVGKPPTTTTVKPTLTTSSPSTVVSSSRSLSAVASSVASSVPSTSFDGFGSYASQAALVRQVLLNSIGSAWEYGVGEDALLEADYPELSVFGSSPFVGTPLPQSVLLLAYTTVQEGLPNGRLALSALDDSSILDTCSPGMGVLLGEGTQGSNATWGQRSELLINYMLTQAPRTATGALSHRSDYLCYWSDGVYMATGFLSAYGLVHNRPDVLNFAYTNIQLYRQALFEPTYNLWGHIRNDVPANAAASQGWRDSGIWATGNVWVLGGIVRLLAAMQKAPDSQQYASEMTNLATWAKQIVDGLLAARASNGLVRNYVNQKSSFGDTASSSLLAWAIYRLAGLLPATYNNSNYINAATSLRTTVLKYVSKTGQLSGAVNPLDWDVTGSLSPEGQAFVLLMMAAWRDFS